MVSKKPSQEAFIFSLQGIRSVIRVPEPVFLKMLGIDPIMWDLFSKDQIRLPVKSLIMASHSFDIDPNRLLTGQIDLDSFASSYNKTYERLPSKYEISNQKLSKMRSLQTIYYSIISSHGTHYANHLLRRLQLHPLHLSNPNDPISLLAGIDLLSELKKEGFQDDQIRKIGISAMEVNQSDALGQAFSHYRTGKELYRAIHEELNHFYDRNWRYQLIGLTDSSCLAKITVRPETAEIFGQKNIGSREACLCRQGIYQSVLRHLNTQPAQITERACAHLGDDYCIYELKWA